MKLDKKKKLAAKALGVGKERIAFNTGRLNEIAEAITRQDFIDLAKSGALRVKEKKGRRKNNEPAIKRGPGRIRKKIVDRKGNYMIITRKLRNYLKEMLKQKRISKEDYIKFRKQIRARVFKSKGHMQSLLHHGGKND